MPKNKIADLRNHLFAQLEKLGEGDLKGEALQEEIQRSKAIANLSSEVIESAKIEVDFIKAVGGSKSSFIGIGPEKDIS